MIQDVTIYGVAISSIVGGILPFILPTLYHLIEKLLKRETTTAEKRWINNGMAFLSAVIIAGFQWEWHGMELKETIFRFVVFAFTNFVSGTGAIQVIYEKIIKNIPKLDRA
jgi:hypothetical protein